MTTAFRYRTSEKKKKVDRKKAMKEMKEKSVCQLKNPIKLRIL